LNREIAVALGEGKDVAKKQTNLRGLRDEMGEAEDLAREIKETALPDARGVLKIAQDDLKIAVQAAIAEARKKYEDQMGQKLDEFMQIYDAWVSATKVVYEEVRPGLLGGTIHEIPQVRNEKFRRYVQNVGLGAYESTPTSTTKEEGEPEREAEIVQKESLASP